MPSWVELIRAPAHSDIAQYTYAATAPKDARFIFLAGSCPLNVLGYDHQLSEIEAIAAVVD